MGISKYIDLYLESGGSADAVWRDMKSGNRLAFSHLFNLYADDLLRYGCQIIKNKSIVEDVIQDVFVSLWVKRENLPEVRSVKFYLMSAVRRNLLRKTKKEHGFNSEQASSSFEISPSFLDQYFQEESEDEMYQKIREVIQSLSERQREIIYLRFYQDFSYKQISEILGLDQKYTYNLASRAFISFREKFGNSIYSIAFVMAFLGI